MLDADDTIEPTMHEVMVANAEKHCADIVACSWRLITKNEVREHKYNYSHDMCFDRGYIEKEIIPNSLCVQGNGKSIDCHCTLLIHLILVSSIIKLPKLSPTKIF